MAKYKNSYEVVSQTQLTEDVFDLVIDCREIAREARAGQFVNVFVSDASKVLPRPISICEVIDSRYLRLVYRVTGINSGTKIISNLVKKDKIALMGPLGNGFPMEEIPGLWDALSLDKSEKRITKVLLIGGGIGIPPMLWLAKKWKAYLADIEHSKSGDFSDGRYKINALLGYRDGHPFLLDDFIKVLQTFVTTDDGSTGFHGTTVDFLRQSKELPDVVMACGPTPMLRALKTFCEEHQILCYLSLEERMACGIGACLACMVNSKDVNPNINIANKRVCKEGPVFLSSEIVL